MLIVTSVKKMQIITNYKPPALFVGISNERTLVKATSEQCLKTAAETK